jgi:tryptophan synthase beta chain
MLAYESYLKGRMNDYIPTDKDLEKGFSELPRVPGIQ